MSLVSPFAPLLCHWFGTIPETHILSANVDVDAQSFGEAHGIILCEHTSERF